LVQNVDGIIKFKMQKRVLLVFFLLINTLLFSQSIYKKFEINWKPVVYNTGNTDEIIPILNFSDAVYNDAFGLLPSFRFDFRLEHKVEKINVVLHNKQFNFAFAINEEKLHPAFLTVEPEISISYNIKEDNAGKYARIEFLPFVKNSLLNSIDLLKSFTLEINYNPSNEKRKSNEHAFAENSVMSSGNWYKFSVNKSGIHKITGTDLQNAGINLASLNPAKIAVYGFGGMLKEKNSDFRYPDIPELPIQLVDGNDGKFDLTDYILFYAQGPDLWEYNLAKSTFEHKLNIYDRNAYYFVNIGNSNGKRIENLNQSNDVSNFEVNTFTDYDFIENETYNLIGSGRRWVGDKFEFVNSAKFKFNIDNLVAGSTANIRSEVVARSSATSSFTYSYNGQSLGSVSISKIPTGSYPAFAYSNFFEKQFTLASSNGIEIDLLYNRPLSGSVGWLDYISINVKRHLTLGASQLIFRNIESVGPSRISKFTLNNASASTLIWDVSNLTNVSTIQGNLSGNSIVFTVNTEILREFIAFTPAMANSVTFVEKIQNQNLHQIANIDMLIVCPKEFLSPAGELAEFHQNEGLKVNVVPLYQIYNEFSSGKQDVSAIRDFVRSVYMHSDASTPLRYLLLFGDASYDYLNKITPNTNLVPTFETYESFDPITSVAIDDYFGFLDVDEGDLYFDDIDIGIGRLPVTNLDEANQAIVKIKNWRNIICFVADDEDNNLHISQADELANLVESYFPAANLDKIYMDAYQQVTTPAGQRYPKANEAINERIEKGALIISYTGHGGETGWGQERYLDMPDVEKWVNKNKLPVFLTATCEFARFDDPSRVSAGEHIFLNKNGGGIALFTTSRATYAGSNFVVSRHFYNYTLNHPQHDYLRMGDILKLTKRASGSGFNVMKFVLIGDPALKLSIPENFVKITQINGSDANQISDTLKALSHIEIKGQVQNKNGDKLVDFNGHVYPLIYDKAVQIKTLANDPGSSEFSFKLQKNVVYKGKTEVKNGDFQFEFVVPKDISYPIDKGKLSLYAAGTNTDAGGFNNNILIGGYLENTQSDLQGPEIEIFMNDDNFVSGGITSENPILFAKVRDENGINTIGNGIGHDITAILDDNYMDLRVLNDYYEADVNTYKSGIIRYPFFKLDEGYHELALKVWDIYNNSSIARVKFLVSSSANLALETLMNYPNPFKENTYFSFEHNAENQELNIVIDIFSINGQLIKHIEENLIAYSSRINHISWDGTDEFGRTIEKGMYIYRIQITNSKGETKSKIAKLVYLK
jgi:hypothetical protein